MDDFAAERRLTRWVVAAAVAGTALLCWRGVAGAFSTPKLTLALVAAVASAALGLATVVRARRVQLSFGPMTVALAVFLLLALLAVVTSPSAGLSLWGQEARGTGFLLYLAGAALLVATAITFDAVAAARLLWVFGAAAAVVAVYALVQYTGNDPISWGGVLGPRSPISTLGNVNFTSGYLAFGVPLAVSMLLRPFRFVRVGGALLLVLLLVAMAASRSAQGFVAAGAGATVVLVVAITTMSSDRRRRVASAALAAVLAVVVLTGLVGITGSGPLAQLNDGGFEFRKDYWRASVTMLGEHPVTGVGFDMWAGYFREARTEEAAVGNFAFVADEPHSVPLGMFTSGGVPLGLSYLAFVALTAFALVRGLRRATGADKAMLATVGGMWLAYQVQAAVSIDVPALAISHFVLAGLVLALSGDVRWAYATRPAARRRRIAPQSSVAAIAVGVLVLVLGSWQAVRLFRADYHLRLARDVAATGDPSGVRHLGRAAGLVPLPEPWIQVSDYFASMQRYELAYVAGVKALERDPRSFVATLNTARMAANSGQANVVERYERALELEPNAPELQEEAATQFRRFGELARAEEHAARAVELAPGESKRWRLLADIRQDRGDLDGARAAARRAERLDPGSAADLLEALED